MLEMISVISGVIGAFAALVGAFVTIRKQRLDSTEVEKRSSGVDAAFRRLTRPLSILLVAVGLAAVSVLLLLEVLGPKAEGSPAALRLLHQLTTEEEKHCEPALPAPRAIAAISCVVVKAPVKSVTMSLFRTVDLLRKTQQQQLGELGVGRGDCYTQALAWESWKHGLLVCDYGGNDLPASLQWSREDSRVLIEALGVPGARPSELYDWWYQTGTGSPENNRLPYPDVLENYILARSDIDAGGCSRATQYRESLASLYCDASVPEYFYLAYYESKDTLRRANATRVGEGSCLSSRQVDGRRRYSVGGRDVGVRLCYQDPDGEAIVAWTNEDSRLYGFAKAGRSSASLERLYRWWERWGRFLTD